MGSRAANIVQDSINWSLSWYPDGRSDSFTKEAILACAPPTSGVYGLFNGDCQIFIGESANIQEALLRHECETEFHSRHLQPTGFTFEPCAEELRQSKAATLIAKYRPVLQTEASLSRVYDLSEDLVVNEPDKAGEDLILPNDDQQFPEHRRDERPKFRSFGARQMLTFALVSLFIASVLVVFFFGVPADYRIYVQASGSNRNSGPGLAKPDMPLDGVAQAAATNNVTVQRVAARPNADSAPYRLNSGMSNMWSVQISAAPAKDVADSLVEQLKTEGYEGYVVSAEVNGKPYFRVRVGPFDAREEAESARQSLAQQEGYRNAYLIRD